MDLVIFIKVIAFLIVLAAVHAKLELQIEGLKGGWAIRLPCWRVDNVFTQLLLGKELTGYHFYLMAVFLMIFHSPFLFIDYSLQKECLCLGAFCYYWIAEDFFWFAENGLYGLRNFRPNRIYWHKRWFVFLPVSYWTSIILGGIFLWLGLL